ncbi:MAG: tRNA (adenosine(37)-N6)-dimethylallyltransferase MiaA [Alphaproteobacteria bacterium]|nr:tRNA (adenosine(37)-N6)-dimethylallyltransferase MiaA [Alphaproteobacteria bacterium]
MSGRILVISGPTASGKSSLALSLADLLDIAIINADSLQLYEGLPILSAQPSVEERKQVPHFLYSFLRPQENSSVVSWLELVRSTVERVWMEGRSPVIVGGSGMYISKLIEGISEIPMIDPTTKKAALQLYDEIGHQEFQQRFGENKIIDKQRLLRAAEVFLQTEKTISFWQKEPKKIFPTADFLHVNLEPEREKLYEKCNARFASMLKNGALTEVKKLDFLSNQQITKTLGFLEIRDFLGGKIAREKMIETATQKTRNYAKRQLTWFRNQLPGKRIFPDLITAYNFLKHEI